MEHNVITHPGGERVEESALGCRGVPEIVSDPTRIFIHIVVLCSVLFCSVVIVILNLFRIVNSIILTFYCIFIAFVTSLNVFMALL